MENLAKELMALIPEGWPRILVLASIVALYLTPHARTVWIDYRHEKARLDKTRAVLELQKLQCEIEALRRQHQLESPPPMVGDDLVSFLQKPSERAAPISFPYLARVKIGFFGSVSFAAFVTMIAAFDAETDFATVEDVVGFAFGIVFVALVGAALAGLFPVRRALASFAIGFALPFALALVVAAIQPHAS